MREAVASAHSSTASDDPAAQLVLRPLSARFDAAAWQDLAEHAIEPNVFAEAWFLQAARALPQAAGVEIAEVWRDGTLIAALPLSIASHYGRLRLPHVQNWLHYHSFVGTPLLRRGAEIDGWRALLAGLDRHPFARGLLHLTGLVEHGPAHRALIAAARGEARPCATVHRIERALLASDLSPQAYLATHVRAKKRKEWRRLESRLAELGTLAIRRFEAATDDREQWAQDYLALEAGGWKGRAGSALGDAEETRRFFLDALAGADVQRRLDMIRLDLDGRAVAMLITFITAPGGFAFKTAFDEDFARFSPGVLLQIAALDLLDRPALDWIDSCAVENHSMIEQLWAERRAIVRVTLPLGGARGAAAFALARIAETASAGLRALRREPQP